MYISISVENNRPLTTEEQAVLVAINPENEILYNQQTPSNPSPRSSTPINGDEEVNDITSYESAAIKVPNKTV